MALCFISPLLKRASGITATLIPLKRRSPDCLNKQSGVNRNKAWMRAITLHGCHRERSTYFFCCNFSSQIIAETGHWSKQLNFLGLIKAVEEITGAQPVEMQYNVTFCHRSREHNSSDPVNSSQRASVACLLGDRSWKLLCVNTTCGSAFLFALVNTRHCLSIGVVLRRCISFTWMGPAVLQLASDKQVNANRSPRLGFTASASYSPPPHRQRVPRLTYGNVKALLYLYSHPCCSCMDYNSITSQVRVSLVAITARHLIYLLWISFWNNSISGARLPVFLRVYNSSFSTYCTYPSHICHRTHLPWTRVYVYNLRMSAKTCEYVCLDPL